MKTRGSDAAGRLGERSALVRPGVVIPDWSVVDDGTARQALAAIFELIGVGHKWAGIGATEDRVWRAVIEGYAALGRAPVPSEIAGTTGMPPEAVVAALAKLRERDVVVLDAEGRITGAYPFSERQTGHRVQLAGSTLTAMCAIDALGCGAMLDADTRIASSCRHCGSAIDVATCSAGTALAAVEPGSAVVWAGIHHAGGCSATSLCTVLTFFCSDEHLAAWRHGDGDGHSGFRLSMDAALQVGRAIFSPILRPGWADDTGGRL